MKTYGSKILIQSVAVIPKSKGAHGKLTGALGSQKFSLCAQMQNWDWSRDCFWLAHFSFHFDWDRLYQHHRTATAEPTWALQTLCLASWVYYLGTFQDPGNHKTSLAHFCKKIAQNGVNSNFFCKNNLCACIAKEKYNIRGAKNDHH